MPDYLGFTDAELVAGVGSFFMPLLIALYMKFKFSDQVRYLLSLLSYIVYTFAAMWFLNFIVFDQDTTTHAVVRGILLSAAVGYGSFKLVWQPTEITQTIEAKHQ
jgi:hypothetical protein